MQPITPDCLRKWPPGLRKENQNIVDLEDTLWICKVIVMKKSLQLRITHQCELFALLVETNICISLEIPENKKI